MKRILGLFLLLASGMSAGAQTLTVASYNLRNANSKDVAQGDGWAQRCPVIADLVRFHDFDIFGAQEVFHSQLLDLLAVRRRCFMANCWTCLQFCPIMAILAWDVTTALKKANTLRFSTSVTGSGSLTRDTFGWLKIPHALSKAGMLLTYAFALGAGFSTEKAASGSGFSRSIPITKVSVHR